MLYKPKKKRTFIDSVKNCLNGFGFIMSAEHNFKRELVLAMLTLTLSYVLRVNKIEFVIILIVISLVIVCEVFNTAIERVVDMYTKEYDERAKNIKDVAAFGVFAMCIFALMIGIIIFIPKIIMLIGG